jgi:hypothetical protein
VVIVGATLTSLSTIVVALRYDSMLTTNTSTTDDICRYYSRHVLMRSVGASDHLILVALVSSL